jgi:hypothetical protein
MRRLLLALSATFVILGLGFPKQVEAMPPCTSIYVCEPACWWDSGEFCEQRRPQYCNLSGSGCGWSSQCYDPPFNAVEYWCNFEG